jgi:serine/threonine protein phosphatase PrpC
MVCSDGLTGAVSDAEIAELLLRNAPQTACDALVDLAVKRGSSDDITVVALRI